MLQNAKFGLDSLTFEALCMIGLFVKKNLPIIKMSNIYFSRGDHAPNARLLCERIMLSLLHLRFSHALTPMTKTQ